MGMMGNKFIIMGMGLILMASILSPLAMGENDSLHVILTVEDRNYSVGDIIDINLNVYNLGVLTDVASPQDIYLGVSKQNTLQNPHNLSLSNEGTGIYKSSYVITDASSLFFFYNVTLGNDHEATPLYEGMMVMIYSIQKNVDVNIAGQEAVSARGGDIITATIITKIGTVLMPISGFTQLYVETPDGQRQEYTTYDTLEDGIYEIDFIVPAVSVSGEYEVVAQPMDMNSQDTATIYVNVLDVWYHKLSSSGNRVSFEVCVADLQGVPIEGANFLIYEPYVSNNTFAGITDSAG
jgi:hypothetical protein